MSSVSSVTPGMTAMLDNPEWLLSNSKCLKLPFAGGMAAVSLEPGFARSNCQQPFPKADRWRAPRGWTICVIIPSVAGGRRKTPGFEL